MLNLKKNTLTLITALAVGLVAMPVLARDGSSGGGDSGGHSSGSNSGSGSSNSGSGSSNSGSGHSVGDHHSRADDAPGHTTRGRGTDDLVGHVRGAEDGDDDAPGHTRRGRGTGGRRGLWIVL